MTASDSGGVGAKSGFLYQDYAAALYLLKMLRDKRLKAVRFEVTDDIDLVYDEYIEYVQVKTTDKDSKWTITEFYETTPLKKGSKRGAPKPQDSILHKSLGGDDIPTIPARFRILTPRAVNAGLIYLTILPHKRADKEGREKLISSLSKKLGTFTSPNGNDAEYWVDNAIWEIIPSLHEIQLEAESAINKASIDEGIYLNPESDVSSILNDILCTVTKKSAISRKINTAVDKSYLREDFLEWFHNEINDINNKSHLHKKIYRTEDLSPILLELVKLNDLQETKKLGNGYYQGYQRGKYRYSYIAEKFKVWLPEILLRPNELADINGLNLDAKFVSLASRIEKNCENIGSLAGQLLLHSIIRHQTKSQPIPAILYIDGTSDLKFFENVHIIRHLHKPDELWMGFSCLVPDTDITNSIKKICDDLDLLLSEGFDKSREKILEVKQDNYIIKHDINELLDSSIPFSEVSDRFRFLIFLGYNSDHLSEDEEQDYKNNITLESKKHFSALFSSIVKFDPYFDQLNISIYLYPSPCINTMLSRIKDELLVNIR